jgi:hypothetical protein
MIHVENASLPIEDLRHTRLIDAPAGSLVYEYNGKISLRADRGLGEGLSQSLAVDVTTWKTSLLEKSDFEQREGVLIGNVTFQVDPTSVRKTQPDGHQAGDLIVGGSDVRVIALNPAGDPVVLALRPTISTLMPSSYSAWKVGVIDPHRGFQALLVQLDM